MAEAGQDPTEVDGTSLLFCKAWSDIAEYCLTPAAGAGPCLTDIEFNEARKLLKINAGQGNRLTYRDLLCNFVRPRTTQNMDGKERRKDADGKERMQVVTDIGVPEKAIPYAYRKKVRAKFAELLFLAASDKAYKNRAIADAKAYKDGVIAEADAYKTRALAEAEGYNNRAIELAQKLNKTEHEQN